MTFGVQKVARSEKRDFNEMLGITIVFVMMLRVRGDEHLIIFGPGGDFFDVRKSTRIFHRILNLKVQNMSSFWLHVMSGSKMIKHR